MVKNGIRIGGLLFILLAALVTILGKGGQSGPEPEVVSVAISPTNFPIGFPVNFPVQLEAQVTRSDGKTSNEPGGVSWSSSDPSVAEISGSGLLTGKAAGGPVSITASAGGKTATLTVPVKSNLTLTKLAITPVSSAGLPIGHQRQHVATATWSDGAATATYNFSQEVEWRSSNEVVVRFDQPAVARGISKGSASISAYERITDTTSNSLQINVDTLAALTPPRLVLSPVLAPGEPLRKGFRIQARALIVYGDGTTSDITDTAEWISRTPNILRVSNSADSKGLVTAIESGLGTIAATAEDVTGTVDYPVPSTSIDSLEVFVPQLPVGLDYQLRVTATLDNPDRTSVDISEYVILAVEDGEVATVGNIGDSKGYLTGLKAGSTTLNVSLPDSEFTTTADIVLVDAALDSIAVRPTQPEKLPTGRKQQFTAVGFFTGLPGAEFDVTRQVTFSSSLSSVADISNALSDKGNATGGSPGTTEISASFGSTGSGAGVRLEVTPAVLQSIAISPFNKTLPRAARTQQFAATGGYSDGTFRNLTSSVTWTSSDEGIARFDVQDGNGLAIVDASGTTIIRAALSGAPESTAGQTNLTVAPAAPISLSIGGGNTVEIGQELILTATATFDDMTQQDVTLAAGWSASNTGVSVANGRVIGRLPGTTTVSSALSGSVRDSVDVTVTLPAGIGLQGSLSLETEEGGRVTASPIVFSCDGPGRCEGEFPLGTVVTLTGIPHPGWRVDDWDGCDIESGATCTVTIRKTNFLRAEFDPSP